MKLISQKMIFSKEYQIRSTTFIKNFFKLIHHWKILFSKNVPNFYQLVILLIYKISKFPLSMLILMQNCH